MGSVLGTAVFFTILSPLSLRAETIALEGRPITRVTYQPPMQALDPLDLAPLEIFKVGGPFHSADAGTIIDRLFATGRFRDVQVDASPDGSGVEVRILAVNTWFVGHIDVQGKVAYPPSREELAEATRLEISDGGELILSEEVLNCGEPGEFGVIWREPASAVGPLLPSQDREVWDGANDCDRGEREHEEQDLLTRIEEALQARVIEELP